jgi:hypothetical protein
MPELLYVHHTIAKLVNTYPSMPSIGNTTPTKLVNTKGNRQYPKTDALLVKVNVEERCDEPWAGEGDGSEDESLKGGDIRESIMCKEMLPRSARP